MVVWCAVSRNLHLTSRNLLGISLVIYVFIAKKRILYVLGFRITLAYSTYLVYKYILGFGQSSVLYASTVCVILVEKEMNYIYLFNQITPSGACQNRRCR